MRALVLSSIIFSMFISSCGSSSSSSTYQDPHSRMHSQMHNELYQEEIDKQLNKQINNFIGQYEGTLPCADCDGIEIQLELFQDFTFQGTVKQVGSDASEMLNGSFTLKANGIVELDKAVAGTTFFQKNNSDLIVLDQNAKEIILIGNDAYVLKPIEKIKVKPFESAHPKADFLKKKWDQGIVFYAIGNEPSWSLDIKRNDSLIFKDPNGMEHKFPFTKALPSVDPKIIDYRSSTKEMEIVIQMAQKPCNDGMSDDSFSYQVNISIKGSKEKESKNYQGCGDYVPDYNLNGNWGVIETQGLQINKNSFSNKEASVSLDMFNQKVSGNDGCNNFHGQVNFKTDQISFGPTAGTLMACPNMELSNKILGSISGRSLNYTLENDLILYEGDKKIMILRRKD